MRLKLGLLLFLVLAFTVSANELAEGFDVSLFPKEQKVRLNQTAHFDLEISHNFPSEEIFEVYSNDVTWDVRLKDNLRVKPGQPFTTNLLIRPLNLQPGSYNLPVNIRRAGSRDEVKYSLYLEVAPSAEADSLLPAVRGVATVDPEVDPRTGLTIKLSLDNQNIRNLQNVDVKIRSNVLNKDHSTSLGASERKTLTFDAELDPKTPPQMDSLQISIIVPDKDKAYQFDLLPIEYSIIPYGSVESSIETESSFFNYVDTVTFVNTGNHELPYSYSLPTSAIKKWFVSGYPAPLDAPGELIWQVSVPSDSEVVVNVHYTYRPIFWAVLLLAVILVLYFALRSPITIKKRAQVIGTHEGGITELKVVLNLVNRGRKAVEHMKMIDLVPQLTQIVKEDKDRVVAPTKVIANKKQGTLLHWDLGTFEPKEHRIIVYKVQTKLSILGGLTLPVTLAKFSDKGKHREVVSNKAEVAFKGRKY